MENPILQEWRSLHFLLWSWFQNSHLKSVLTSNARTCQYLQARNSEDLGAAWQLSACSFRVLCHHWYPPAELRHRCAQNLKWDTDAKRPVKTMVDPTLQPVESTVNHDRPYTPTSGVHSKYKPVGTSKSSLTPIFRKCCTRIVKSLPIYMGQEHFSSYYKYTSTLPVPLSTVWCKTSARVRAQPSQ